MLAVRYYNEGVKFCLKKNNVEEFVKEFNDKGIDILELKK